MSVLPQVELTGGLAGGDLDPATTLTGALQTYRAQVSTDLQRAAATADVEEVTHEWLTEKLLNITGHHLNLFRIVVGAAFRPVVTRTFFENGVALDETTAAGTADAYAMRVGTYVASSSSAAVMDGFTRMLNAKVPPKEAARRAGQAFGLTTQQMRALLTVAPEQKVASSERREPVGMKVLDFIANFFSSRLHLLVKQSVREVESMARQAAWDAGLLDGSIAPDTVKVWITAADEKTCPVCAPMDGVQVDLSAHFTLPDGSQALVPPVHPNCRCEVTLAQPDEFPDGVAKSFNDEHPRTATGQFRVKTKAQEMPLSPEMAAMFAGVDAEITRREREVREREARDTTRRERTARERQVRQRTVRERSARERGTRAQVAERVSTGRTKTQRVTASTRAKPVNLSRAMRAATHTDREIPPLVTPKQTNGAEPGIMRLGTHGAAAVVSYRDLGIDPNQSSGRVNLDYSTIFDDARSWDEESVRQSRIADALDGMESQINRQANRSGNITVPYDFLGDIDSAKARGIGSDLFLQPHAPAHSGDLHITFSQNEVRRAAQNLAAGQVGEHSVTIEDADGHPLMPDRLESDTLAALAGISNADMPVVVKVRQGWDEPGQGWFTDGTEGEEFTLSGPFIWERAYNGVITLTPDLDALDTPPVGE